MVLGLALFATAAVAQTNNCVNQRETSRFAKLEAGVMQKPSVDYKASIFTKGRSNNVVGDTLIDGFWNFDDRTGMVFGANAVIGTGEYVKMQDPDSNYAWVNVNAPVHNVSSGDASVFMFVPDTNYLRQHSTEYSGGALAQFGFNIDWIIGNLMYYATASEPDGASHVNNLMFIYPGGVAVSSSQNVDAYVKLPAITNPNTNSLYEVRMHQDCMKWYEYEYIEFKVGSEWYSVEYNVLGVDVDRVQRWVAVTKSVTMPLEFGRQPNLELRFRVLGYGPYGVQSNTYGFYYALDDVAIVRATSDHWTAVKEEYIDGAYSTIPFGMNIPLAWYGHVSNDGANNIYNATATAWHLSNNGTATALTSGVTDSLIPIASAAQYLKLDERGFFSHPYGETRPLFNYAPCWDTTSDVLPASYTRVGLPATTAGTNYITITGTAGTDYDTLEFDTIAYRVVGSTGGEGTNLKVAGWRLAHDNGIIPSRSLYQFGYSSENTYTTSADYFAADYTVLSQYTTPDVVPTDDDGNPWVIRGIELVPQTDTTAAAMVGSVISPYVAQVYWTDSSDGSLYWRHPYVGSSFTGLSDEYTYTVTEDDVDSYFDNKTGVKYPGDDYKAVNIRFMGQPELRPNVSYYFGYTMAQNGYFGVARHLYGYYNEAGSVVRYNADPEISNFYNQFKPIYGDVMVYDSRWGVTGGDNYPYWPLIRLIVGPREERNEFSINAVCSVTDTNFVIAAYEDGRLVNICDTSILAYEGAEATVRIYATGDSTSLHPGVIDAIIIDGVSIAVTDEDSFFGDDYTITEVPEALRDQDGNVVFRRSNFIVTFPSVEGNHTVSAAGHAGTLGIESEGINVALGLKPNPATNSVTLNMRGIEGMVNCSIIDMSGRVVYNRPINAESSRTIDLSNVAAGAYFVRVTNDKFSKVEKLIVR